MQFWNFDGTWIHDQMKEGGFNLIMVYLYKFVDTFIVWNFIGWY